MTDTIVEAGPPAVVLVAPQLGENIGTAARAMANFGLVDLRLVNPRDRAHQHRAATIEAAAVHHLPVSLDLQGILTNQVVRQLVRGGFHRRWLRRKRGPGTFDEITVDGRKRWAVSGAVL